MRKAFILSATLLTLCTARAQEMLFALNDGWQFCRDGESEWREARVPGCVQTDLFEHGLIPDFKRDSNIDSVQWIERNDWVYRRYIRVDRPIEKADHIDLEFKGLDTFAEIYLNGALVGTADNMFRSWRWDVKPFIRSGENELKVIFRSPLRKGKELLGAYGAALPHDSDTSGVSPFIRKAAFQFGWDFCPRLVTMGIWKNVTLHAWSQGRIADANVQWSGDEIIVTPEFDTRTVLPSKARIELQLDGKPLKARWNTRSSTLRTRMPVDVLPNWMPRGMGQAKVKRLKMVLSDGSKALSVAEFPIGRGGIKLIQEPDSIGQSFRFACHGQAVFAKGCNVIPPDLVVSGITDSAWLQLVRHMQLAGMNMARVWAGGIYPPESFFDACDTAGIMIWQDFMLANLVPAEADFRENLLSEAKDQVARIAHHPCVALFCGNNELRVAWENWGWQERYGIHGEDSARVIHSNEDLWSDDLARIADASLGPARYTPTSPLSNWGNSKGLRHGDLHFWGVWHGDSAFSSFDGNVGRFMSEWGFQSYPDSSLLARYLEPDSLIRGSAMVKRLQRSYKGDAPIWKAMRSEGLDLPLEMSLGRFIEASQELQALAYGRAVRAHMKTQPHCAGTLLWQLNDCWPGPSWSIIDYAGNRKPAFEAVRAAFLSK